jgi:DNA modification methylase
MKTWRYKRGYLVRGDCLKVMKRVPKESVDLIFADPPFNIGYKYDKYDDSVDRVKFLTWTRLWIKECYRVLKRDGSIFVCMGDEYAADIKLILDSHFHFRNWIIWQYNFGCYTDKKFGRGHTHIFYYTRDKKDFTWNADAIRMPSARQTKYNDKRANPKGRVPSDVWMYPSDVWNIPRICGTFKERTKHPCQMPATILHKIIAVASDPGDVILDPFAGSGTTLDVANQLKRKFIGSEISKGYCKIIRSRLGA